MGGKTYRVIFFLGGWGGETCYKVHPPKPQLEVSESGIVWSVPVSFKEHAMVSSKLLSIKKNLSLLKTRTGAFKNPSKKHLLLKSLQRTLLRNT